MTQNQDAELEFMRSLLGKPATDEAPIEPPEGDNPTASATDDDLAAVHALFH